MVPYFKRFLRFVFSIVGTQVMRARKSRNTRRIQESNWLIKGIAFGALLETSGAALKDSQVQKGHLSFQILCTMFLDYTTILSRNWILGTGQLQSIFRICSETLIDKSYRLIVTGKYLWAYSNHWLYCIWTVPSSPKLDWRNPNFIFFVRWYSGSDINFLWLTK